MRGRLPSGRKSYILIDSIYAVLILSFSFATISSFQVHIARHNKPVLRDYDASHDLMVRGILDDSFTPSSFTTRSGRTYDTRVLSSPNLVLILPR